MVAARLEKNRRERIFGRIRYDLRKARQRCLLPTKIEVIRMIDGEWLLQCPKCNLSHHE
jgi:hypothetical protein